MLLMVLPAREPAIGLIPDKVTMVTGGWLVLLAVIRARRSLSHCPVPRG